MIRRDLRRTLERQLGGGGDHAVGIERERIAHADPEIGAVGVLRQPAPDQRDGIALQALAMHGIGGIEDLGTGAEAFEKFGALKREFAVGLARLGRRRSRRSGKGRRSLPGISRHTKQQGSGGKLKRGTAQAGEAPQTAESRTGKEKNEQPAHQRRFLKRPRASQRADGKQEQRSDPERRRHDVKRRIIG